MGRYWTWLCPRTELCGVDRPKIKPATSIQSRQKIPASRRRFWRRASTVASTCCQVDQQRQYVPRKPSDLLGFLFVRPQQIQNHVADPGGVKCPNPLGDHLRRAKSAVAFCRFTKVHGVTNAQGFGRAVQCFFVGAVETGEQKVAGA